MSRPPEAAELSLPVPADTHDPELEALPEPRRPGRALTLVCMALTALVALLMAISMRGEALYALHSGAPTELGNLANFAPRSDLANTWVHGEALLGSTSAIRYGRPLETDTYRLAPVAGNPRLWVQIRVPEGMEGPHFVPPTLLVDGEAPTTTRWALGLITLFVAFFAFNLWGLYRLLRPVRD
jgi:hypothetical protein